MGGEPGARALLAAAREALLRDAAPGLEGEPRRAVALAARAIEAALAEMEAGDDPEPARRLLDRYAALYGRDAVDAAGADTPSRLRALERRLARDIRAGAFDDDPAGPALDLALEGLALRLERFAPDFARAGAFSQPRLE